MTTQYDLSIEDFDIGARIETHPATDAWMQGDRFGNVVKIGRKYVHVRMDVSGKVKQFSPENLGLVITTTITRVRIPAPAVRFRNSDGRVISTRSSNPRDRKLAKKLARKQEAK